MKFTDKLFITSLVLFVSWVFGDLKIAATHTSWMLWWISVIVIPLIEWLESKGESK